MDSFDADMERARQLIEHRRPEEARQILLGALGDQPDDPWLHELLARTFVATDDFKEAEEFARVLMQIAPDHSRSYVVLTEVLLHAGQLDAAVPVARRAVEVDPNDPDAQAILSEVHTERLEWQDGLACANRALELDPNDYIATNARARCLVGRGQSEQAESTLMRALEVSPEDSYVHTNTGWTLLNWGEFERAEQHFVEALRLDPTGAWAREGVREALQARQSFYRPFLRLQLWIERSVFLDQSTGICVLVALGVLSEAANGDNPTVVFWGSALFWSVLGLSLAVYFATTIAAAVLSLSPVARLALTRAECNWARGVGLMVALGLILIVGSVIHMEWEIGRPGWMLIGLAAAIRRLPDTSSGWPRLLYCVFVSLVLGVVVNGLFSHFAAFHTGLQETHLLQWFGTLEGMSEEGARAAAQVAMERTVMAMSLGAAFSAFFLGVTGNAPNKP